MKKIKLILICFLLSACTFQKEKKLYDDYTLNGGFDTVITYKFYATSENEFNQETQKATELFLYYHQLFDKYNNYDMNNIKTINDNAGIQSVEVSQDLIDLLLLSKQYSEISQNQFDITLGSVLNIWHNVREKAENNEDYQMPSQDELKQAFACSGWDKVEINDENNTVYLNNSCASLDVGAVAKGYATQKVSEMLISDGYTNGFINAGGNIQFLGPKIDGTGWNAGIVKPSLDNASESLLVLPIQEANAFVTSGDYQRYFIYNDQIMHHIIDPDTLYPAKHAKSISVITKDGGIADILSTTLFTMTYQEGVHLIEMVHENGIDVEVVWIYDQLDEIQNEDYIKKDGYYIIATSNIDLK
ncbi:MAG: FAD:protein FMN transferase [Traorella sp.]